MASNDEPPKEWFEHENEIIPHSKVAEFEKKLEKWKYIIFIYVEDEDKWLPLNKEYQDAKIEDYLYVVKQKLSV